MDLKRLFYPESVAVVGASPNTGGGRIPYFQLLQEKGYQGEIYPVNPRYEEVAGVKTYPSIDDLPHGVDLLIISLPAERAVEIVESAVRKKIKFIHFFTSGFSEMGNTHIEESMITKAREGETCIVGPNCIGVLCTESRITFYNEFREDIGGVAFMGQSGGVTSNFVGMAHSRHVKLNKVVSYGNQMDIRVEDYINYFVEDDTVSVIAAYIEDIKDGQKFIETLKKATPKKPVVILKGGVTDAGARAAASHTGAMSTKGHIWSSVMTQFRCIEVDYFEQLLDISMLITAAKVPHGPRVGFLGAGGGTSVLFTDLAVKKGLQLPELNKKTQDKISERIMEVNSFTTNPVDLGQSGFDFSIMAHTMEAMDEDDNIDIIIPYFSLDFITRFQNDQVESGAQVLVDTYRELKKPIIPILARFTEDSLAIEETRIRIYAQLREAGLPVFYTIQDAVAAVSMYLEWRGKER
ncbi:MAG: hypothetical protein GY754_34940 [bacterium]|nr:hypothetical protein [bacterium]